MSEQVTYTHCANCKKLIHAMHLNTFSIKGLAVCNPCYNLHHNIPYLCNFYVCYECEVLDERGNRNKKILRAIKSTNDEATDWLLNAKIKYGGKRLSFQIPKNME